jgi:polynucleotide 5'-hydroxyl-kinase GRC3/NOL9
MGIVLGVAGTMRKVRLEDFLQDRKIVGEIRAQKSRLIMIIGGADTGKTTLVQCLADSLSEEMDVGVVDLDVGQSHIGPPTTVGWGTLTGGFNDWGSIRVRDFYFTGSVTPPASLLPILAGSKLMTECALAASKKVIVDTTGLVDEPAGRVLKQGKIDLLRPDLIIALERRNELSLVLQPYEFSVIPGIFRVPVPSSVRHRDVFRRASYRTEMFKAYFAQAHMHEVSLDSTALRFTGKRFNVGSAVLDNRLVSFRNRENNDIAVGIIRGVSEHGNSLRVLSPMEMHQEYTTLVIGMATVTL